MFEKTAYRRVAFHADCDGIGVTGLLARADAGEQICTRGPIGLVFHETLIVGNAVQVFKSSTWAKLFRDRECAIDSDDG